MIARDDRPPVIDPALPALAEALDPSRAAQRMASAKAFAGATVRVAAAELIRLKAGRRAVIDYHLAVEWPDGRHEDVRAIGKMRAHRQPRTGYRRLRSFWRAGFAATSSDRICVPEPIGVVPALGLWLQRRVPGCLATDVLATPAGVALARRVVDAARKLHAAGVATERTHGPADELAILERVLAGVADREPACRGRVQRLAAGCRRLTALVDAPATGIHRDFYADQVIVDGDRLVLLDFDLYCAGPAALDFGNFAGHLAEQQVREPQHAAALAAAEAALVAAYAEHTGDDGRLAVRIYAALTLARHVYLSTVVAGRGATTGTLLDLASQRVEALLDEVA